jgi:phosphatidylserine decarboxylase
MHLLFCTSHKYLKNHYIESELKRQSIAQGKLFDSEEGAQEHIKSFISVYNLESTLKDLLEPDPTKYKTFNDFFVRKLAPGVRPIAAPLDPSVIVSGADCRLTVWNDIDTAKKFWVKSKEFDLPHLFGSEELASLPEFKDGGALAIFRLAPADFHRFSSPVTGKLGTILHHPGTYYTVNPQAVNEECVRTSDRRFH